MGWRQVATRCRRVCAFGVARQASFVFAFNGVPRCIMQGGKTSQENERDGDSLGSSLSSFRRSSDRFASPSTLEKVVSALRARNRLGGMHNDSKCREIKQESLIFELPNLRIRAKRRS